MAAEGAAAGGSGVHSSCVPDETPTGLHQNRILDKHSSVLLAVLEDSFPLAEIVDAAMSPPALHPPCQYLRTRAAGRV